MADRGVGVVGAKPFGLLLQLGDSLLPWKLVDRLHHGLHLLFQLLGQLVAHVVDLVVAAALQCECLFGFNTTRFFFPLIGPPESLFDHQAGNTNPVCRGGGAIILKYFPPLRVHEVYPVCIPKEVPVTFSIAKLNGTPL